MRRFLAKGAAFLAAMAVLIGLLDWQYIRTDHFDTNRFQDIPDGIQVCNFGASFSRYGIDYEDVDDGITTFNFALIAQSHEYDYRLLNYYKDKLADGCVVLIVLSNVILVGREEMERPEFKALNSRYYTFLPDELIRGFDRIEKYKVQFIPFIFKNTLRDILAAKDLEYWRNRNMEGMDLRAIADHDVKKDWIDVAARDESGKAVAVEGEVQAIYKMISLCREIGATPVLLTTPFTRDFCDSVAANAAQENEVFYDTISRICADTGVEFYDYSSDERFMDDYSLFMDKAHMNQKGARMFTDTIMKELIYDRIKTEQI